MCSIPPSNGNEIAKQSGVPTPKVYETLRNMKKKGLVYVVSDNEQGKSIKYQAFPFKKILKIKETNFMNDINFLKETLPKISSSNHPKWTDLFVIEGYPAFIEVIQSSIVKAQSEIIMSCWMKEFNILKNLLVEAYNRKVNITTLIFDGHDIKVPWRNFTHYNNAEINRRHLGEFSLVIDQKQTFLHHSWKSSPHTVVSNHPATSLVTRNYIRHDIYVNRILKDFQEEMIHYYGEKLEKLIDDF